jgi:hypothetical protein
MARRDHRRRLILEEFLDDPVFKRMICDDHKSTPRSKQIESVAESFLQMFEFGVHLDAQGLENAGKSLLGHMPTGNREDNIGKLPGCRNWPEVALSCDFTGNPAGVLFFTVFKEYPG